MPQRVYFIPGLSLSNIYCSNHGLMLLSTFAFWLWEGSFRASVMPGIGTGAKELWQQNRLTFHHAFYLLIMFSSVLYTSKQGN